MVKRLAALLLFVLFFIVNVNAENENAKASTLQEFENANQLFIAKDYSGAIESYNLILDKGFESAGLYYNLGNAYYRIGQLGYAVLNYEKALKLDPKDEDIIHNLALANFRTIDRVETLPEFFIFEWWEGLLNFFTLAEWTWLVFSFYILFLAAAAFYFFAGRAGKQKKALTAGLIILTILLLSSSLLIIKYNRQVNEQHGVIVKNTLTVKLTPEETSGEAFVIHEGLKIKIEDKLNNWLKIRLIDGKTGWIREGEVEVI